MENIKQKTPFIVSSTVNDISDFKFDMTIGKITVGYPNGMIRIKFPTSSNAILPNGAHLICTFD